MPALEVYDTVVLKANRQLVGFVGRTHYQNHDPLHDTLIIAHVTIDPSILTEFVTTGAPPKNYVFISFADEAKGSSLVHVDDVILLDRSFNLGDFVKQKDSQMLGTVTSVTETYTIRPVWLNAISLADGSPAPMPLEELLKARDNQHFCTFECPVPVQENANDPLAHFDIHGIPGDELKRVEDILEADFIVQDDWLGIVEELELIVVILMEDESIVVVKNPEELYIPVADLGKPLVSLPEFDELLRPDPLVALQGWSATIPPEDLRSGQLVITNPRNLRQGRWLRGQFNASIKPTGRILDVRTRSAEVRWLSCNPFIPEETFTIDRPPSRVTPYENIDRFPRRSELRFNKKLAVYDPARRPRVTESRTRGREDVDLPLPTTRMPNEFRVGDHVKFRDQAGAAVKYQGIACPKGILHGRFGRIPSTALFGFDVNELKIVASQQQSTVVWQDGTTSCHTSKTLTKFSLFESELAPADLVVAREGMKQVSEQMGNGTRGIAVDFNEMNFFENPHDLLPKKVGVVQTVNQTERVAQVRWFLKSAQPVRLLSYGHILGGYSRYGKLSEVVEDVSLYEIMTFPAMIRRLKDLVIIPPESFSVKTQEIMWSDSMRLPRQVGQATLSQIDPYNTGDLLGWLQGAARTITHDSLPRRIDDLQYRAHPSLDWVGEIVGLGLDGVVTVRLNLGDICKDIRLEHDQIICLIDDAAISGVELAQDDDAMDIDLGLSGDEFHGEDTASTISETVEYEGGERIDVDSGDENWEDAGDDTAEDKVTVASTVERSQDVGPLGVENSSSTASGRVAEHAPVETGEQMSVGLAEASLKQLRSKLPPSEPAMFSVLEQDPPADQYQDSKQEFTSSPYFLKRIAREHRILASSLPQSEIYVRTYENRLDLMRCLILGPADTPYEHAPFLIDLQLGKNFPREPPIAHFHSWTSGLGRINPNLYEEGKICLSLLGTWPGKSDTEGWSEKATILQLLVSLQGLVFVRQPFYNEAGFEEYAAEDAYALEALRYNEKAYVMARGFIKHAVCAPVQGLEDVLAWIYLGQHQRSRGLLDTVISRGHSLMQCSEEKGSDGQPLLDGQGKNDDKTKVFLSPLSRGAMVMLRKTIRSLEDLLAASR